MENQKVSGGQLVSETIHNLAAISNIAEAMSEKLLRTTREGRHGWHTKEVTNEMLSTLLVEAVGKGDPVDIANYAAMLHARGERATVPVSTWEERKLGHDPAASSNAAIKFALKNDDCEGLTFLRVWSEGNFAAIREEWDNVPEEVFIGADPLHPLTKYPDLIQHISGIFGAPPVKLTGTIHQLKTDPIPFTAVAEGFKTHEIRLDDRGYKVGDVLELYLFDPTAAVVPPPLIRVISHIQADYGLRTETGRTAPCNWVVLSFAGFAPRDDATSAATPRFRARTVELAP